MDVFRLNWFLGALAVDLWLSAVVVAWGPEMLAHWRRRAAWRRAVKQHSAVPPATSRHPAGRLA